MQIRRAVNMNYGSGSGSVEPLIRITTSDPAPIGNILAAFGFIF
jgi:hypothetical protein